jgi:rhodanese-related sulfurtransferase
MPLNHLREQMATLSRESPVLVHCAGGYRSSIAASLLRRDGFTRVSELAGGISAWQQAGLPSIAGGDSAPPR